MFEAQLKLIIEERQAVAKKIKDLVSLSEAEDRDFTESDTAQYDEYRQRIDQLDHRKARLETLIKEDREASQLATVIDQEGETRMEMQRDSFHPSNIDPLKPLTQAEQCMAFRAWFAAPAEYHGKQEDLECLKRMAGPDRWMQKSWDVTVHRGQDPSGGAFRAPKTMAELDYQARCRRESTPEQRFEQTSGTRLYQDKGQELRATNVVGTPNLGGNLVPDEFIRPLENALLWYGGMRQVAEIHSSAHGGSWPIPTSNDTNQKGAIVDEDAQVPVQEIIYGQVTLGAYKFSSKMVHISVELMQDSATNMSADIGMKLGERVGRITNEKFTVGTGTSEPRGILADSVQGKVSASLSAITWEELVDLQHSVDIAYRNQNAMWMFHDSTLALIKKDVKDSQNRPLWLPSTRDNEPDFLLGHRYQINNDMPAIGANANFMLFGALQKYLIRDVLGWNLLRLDERYAEFHRIAFLGFNRQDGRLIDAGTNPVKHMTAPAS